MKRRQFIVLATGASMSLATAAYWVLHDTERALTAYVKSMVGVSQLGEIYVKNSTTQQGFLIQLNNKLSPYSSLRTIEEVGLAVKLAIKNDFLKDKLCFVEGWRVTETECLLAASYVSLPSHKKTEVVAVEETFSNARIEDFLIVEHWGPQSTIKGKKFNPQSDGHAGLWFIVENPIPNLVIYVNGRPEKTVTNERSLTSGIHDLEYLDSFLKTVGDSEVAIYDEIKHRKQIVGRFEVLPVPERLVYPDGRVSAVFCPIESWGPQNAEYGKVFNRQPNGNAAVWIKTKCASDTVKVLINDKALETSVSPGIITANIPAEDLDVSKECIN